MNYNLLTYAIYLSIMIFIIVYVGRYFYKNGRLFILALLQNDEEQTDYLNKALLIAYYLFNIGYTLINLIFWTVVEDTKGVIDSLGNNIGMLVLILAVTHYFNMALIHYLSKNKKVIFHK